MQRMMKILFSLVLILMLGSCGTSDDDMATLTGDTGCVPVAEILNFNGAVATRKIVIKDDCDDSGANCKSEEGIIEWMDGKITGSVKMASLLVWLKLTLNVEFRWLLSMMLTVSVLLFAGSILLGMTQASGYNIVMYMFKLIIIYQLAVNYIYFNIYVVQSFESLLSDVMSATALTFSDYVSTSTKGACLGVFGSVACDIPGTITSLFGIDIFSLLHISSSTAGSVMLFGAMDNMLSRIFDFHLWQLILGLLSMGKTGIFYSVMVFAMIVAYFGTVVIAIKTYFMAEIARWVLYGLAPLFLSFALFNQTRSLFDGWLQQLINYTLQPVFLFIFLGMFHSMLSGFMTQLYADVESGTKAQFPMDCAALGDPTLVKQCNNDNKTKNVCKNGQDAANGNRACSCLNDDKGHKVDTCNYQMTSLNTGGMCVKYTDQTNENTKQKFKWFKLCSGPNNCAADINPVLPINIWMVFSIIIVCYMMSAMCHWVVQIAAQLSSGAVTLSDVRIMGLDRITSQIKGGLGKGIMNSFKGGDAPRQ